jgi:hypothetical protein
VKREQLVAAPNDKSVRIQCLNNASFVGAVDPVMTGGRGECKSRIITMILIMTVVKSVIAATLEPQLQFRLR